ncbi:MAG: prolipoprotein diacylglyceryl transferase family protein [Actinomycetota bacterium]
MIDFGLLLSMLAVVGVPTLLQRRWPLRTADGASFTDLAVIAIIAGVIVGRIVSVAVESPGSLGRVGDLLIIRSGVDFWPGAVAGLAVLWWDARRVGVSLVDRLADLAPLGLMAYAAYEACCLFRDGCFGPVSAFGLRPPGVATAMVPIGLIVAAAVVGLALIVRRADGGGWGAPTVVVGAVAGVAVVRSVASIWLPHVGDGLTRHHWLSIAVAAVAVPVATMLVLRHRASAGSDTAPVGGEGAQ